MKNDFYENEFMDQKTNESKKPNKSRKEVTKVSFNDEQSPKSRNEEIIFQAFSDNQEGEDGEKFS